MPPLWLTTLPGMPNMRVRMVLGNGELFGWLCSAPGRRSGGECLWEGAAQTAGRHWRRTTPTVGTRDSPRASEVPDGEFAGGGGPVRFAHPTASFGVGVLGLVLLAPNPGRLP